MENGVENLERDMNGGEDEYLEVRVEEKSAAGSHVLRGSERDDVFEEAIEADIPIVDSEDRVMGGDGNIEKLVDSGGSMGVDENLENGNGVERFEEAIGVPSAIMRSDQGAGEEAEVRVSEVSPIKESSDEAVGLVTEKSLIVEEAVVGKVLADEIERLKDDGVGEIGENGENESIHAADLGATIKTANYVDNDEVNENLNDVLMISEDDIVNHVNVDLIHDGMNSDKQEKHSHDHPETQDANEIKVNGVYGICRELENNTASHGLEHQSGDINEHMGDLFKSDDVLREEKITVEEKVALGSHGPRGKEGDVFEESINTEIPDVDSEDRVVGDDGNIKRVGDLGGYVGVNDNLKNENEVEGLGESTGVPSVILRSGEGIGEKAEERVSEVSPISASDETPNASKDSDDKVEHLVTEKSLIAEEAIAGEVLADEAERLKLEGVAENGGNEPTVAADLGATITTPNSKGEHEISGEVLKKAEDDIMHHVNVDLTHYGMDSDKQEKQIYERPRNQDSNEIKGGNIDSQQEVESNGDIVQQAVKNIEVNEIYPEVDLPPITSEDSSVEEITKAPEVKHSPNLKDSLSAPLSSSDSEMKSSGVAEPQVTDANKGVSEGVVNKTEKKMEKDEEAKVSIPSNRQQEIKPTMDNSASAVRSAAPAPPAGLGRAAALLEPAARMMQQPRMNGTVSPQQNQLAEEPTNGEPEEFDETREKLQMIRVKFLRLAHRLGQTPHNVVVAQVLYRLGLAEQLRGRNGGRVAAFSFDRASAMAEQLEAAGQEPLDFSCTIMVLGKTGVGKSSTINSIFDEVKFGTDPFQLATKKVQDVIGTVQGIKVRVIDTPGLLPSWSDQQQNKKTLHSIKKFIKKTPPDIVLYLDRLDMQSRDLGDMPLLRSITDVFGPSVWFNAIVVLTHAASAPPEGPNGTATSYDTFVTQRSHAVQQAIRQAAGDMRLMNPVSLVENHLACRTNRAGQRVLPNGQIWKPHLLLLSFASKILAEANTLLKLQDSPPGRPFAARTRAPSLPFLLSSLLQSRPHVKLPTEQFDDDDDSLYDDLDESSDSEEESEYDQLPPFRSLTKSQLAKLPRDQRNAYYAELEYRENLFMKKQLREDKKRRKILKKMQAAAKNLPADYNGSAEEESNDASSVPIAMPDLSLPASFDSDNPTHRYRYLDSSNQWLVRPVLEPNGWDHDVGYEGINVEKLFVVKEKIPISFSGQVSKDKKDTNLQMELATSVKHNEGKATSLGFDMQSVGKDIAYTLRGETRFSNFRRNKATAGLSLTILGDVVSGGVKVEDKLIVNKRGQVVVSGGAMFGRGDAAYGGSLEATLRDKDHPLGRFLSTLGISVMDWHGDLAIGCNSQTQIPIGRYSNLIGRININNRGSGQVSIRLNSSEQLQIALIALFPFARKLLGYSQTMQYG